MDNPNNEKKIIKNNINDKINDDINDKINDYINDKINDDINDKINDDINDKINHDINDTYHQNTKIKKSIKKTLNINDNQKKNNNTKNIQSQIYNNIDKEQTDTSDIYSIEYFKKNLSFCCNKDNDYIIKDFDTIYKIIHDLKTLNNMQKNIILVRFHRISVYCLKNYKSVSKFYTFSKLFIITCGILNPALLSINSNKDNKYYNLIYWSVWILQLSVSLITSFVSFYKWDRKYFLYNSYRSKINQEIWYYLELTGKYNIKDEEECIINHDTRFTLFLERVEYLFRKLKNTDLEIEFSEDEKKDDIKANYSNLNPTPSPDYNYQNQEISITEN